MSSLTLWIVTVSAAGAAMLFAIVALVLSVRPSRRRAAAQAEGQPPAPTDEGTGRSDEVEVRRLREAAELASMLDLRALCDRVLDAGILASGAEAGAIAIESSAPAGPVVVSRRLSDAELSWLSSPLTARNDSAIITRYLYEGRTHGDERFATALLVPLRDADGEPVGNLAALWRVDLAQEADNRLHALEEVVGTAAGAIANALRFYEVSALSIRDTGTGLLDRRYFVGKLGDEVELARAGQQRFALLLVLVEGLTVVEARQGAAAADGLLTRIAERLRAELRLPEEVFRIGRAELAAFVRGGESADVQAAVNRIRRSLDDLTHDAGTTLTCAAAIADLRPDDSATSLYERADAALRGARSMQPGGVVAAA